MVGAKVEHAGIIRHGAKMLYAVSRATVPKITVVVRKAYGAGYYVMNGRAYEPDLIVAWPSAEISVMGAEGAVNIIGRSAIEASDDPDATREKMLEAVREQIDPYIPAGNAMIDDIIDPARDARDDRARPADGVQQARGPPLEEAWGDAGLTEGPREARFGRVILSFDGRMVEATGIPGREDLRIHIEHLNRLDCKVKGHKASLTLVAPGKIYGSTEKLDPDAIAAVEGWAAEVRAEAPNLQEGG